MATCVKQDTPKSDTLLKLIIMDETFFRWVCLNYFSSMKSLFLEGLLSLLLFEKSIALHCFPAVDRSLLILPAFSPAPRTSEQLRKHKLKT